MEMTPQTPNDTFYMSAPASPRRISLEVGGLCFFNVPTSPTRTLRVAYDVDIEPTTPKTCEDSSSNVDEFEFETSRRFNVDEYEVHSKQKPESQPGEPKESLPAIAFAEELFYDGKVMPLKPPPRLQYHKQSSTLSSPWSPSRGLRLPFQRRSLWNDDFDPFMVALKNVKEEKVGKSQAKNHRRARSMSPFREREPTPKETNDLLVSNQLQINQMGLILPTKQSDPNSNKTIGSNESAFWMLGRQEQVNQEKKRELKLAEPKGVLFARRARLVKVGNEKPRKPSVMMDLTMEAGGSGKQTKGQKIKNFIFRSRSMRTMSNVKKPICSANGAESRPKLKRKFSLKSMGISQYNEEKTVSEVTLTTLVRYRPKLWLCMGYGAKYVK